MNWLSINIDVQHRACLIIGGGALAERKCHTLLAAGAKLTVIAKELDERLQVRAEQNEFEYLAVDILEHLEHLKQYELIICATNHKAVNAQVAASAKAQGVLVNVVDDAQLSNVILPAVIDQSPLLISVSTAGQAPILASLLKAKIQSLLPADLNTFCLNLSKLRHWLRESALPMNQRRVILNTIVSNYLKGELGSETSEPQLITKAKAIMDEDEPRGMVYFIGAGPGDPELLTLKAHRILQNCDIILYDNLVSPQHLDYCRKDAEKIYVGKQADKCHTDQNQINQLMLGYVAQGLQVVRLKGGDPAIFSRAGEEYRFLRDHNINFAVIPGVTAALACAAAMDIPLTHRDHAQGCLFITAHTAKQEHYDWQYLANARMTLVFYMGLKSLENICQQLLMHGMPAQMPIAVIAQGTMPQQEIYISTINELKHKIKPEILKSPVLIIIGQVVKMNLQEHKNGG
ncbi:MAG: siroheme synthase CysG [Gammaproteobacteria bacterium]